MRDFIIFLLLAILIVLASYACGLEEENRKLREAATSTYSVIPDSEWLTPDYEGTLDECREYVERFGEHHSYQIVILSE